MPPALFFFNIGWLLGVFRVSISVKKWLLSIRQEITSVGDDVEQ